jgi:hypothetical protein
MRLAGLGVDQAAARQDPAGVDVAPAQHLEQVDRIALPAERGQTGLEPGGLDQEVRQHQRRAGFPVPVRVASEHVAQIERAAGRRRVELIRHLDETSAPAMHDTGVPSGRLAEDREPHGVTTGDGDGPERERQLEPDPAIRPGKPIGRWRRPEVDSLHARP